MRQDRPRNMAASVKARLLEVARSQHEESQSVLNRYAIERFLYRLSLSEHRSHFILKGASLFALWLGAAHRPTRDVDFLGYGSDKVEPMLESFRLICREPVEDDGLIFEPGTVKGGPIRENARYAGIRITLRALLGTANIPLQIDIGFGDIVTPEAQEADLPTLLDSPKPRMLTYPRETVVAEKCEAMIDLGLSNSRLKDFYDLWHLATHFDFEGPLLSQAIAATFKRRSTDIPALPPVALTNDYYGDGNIQKQWSSFLARSGLPPDDNPTLKECIELLQAFLLPLLHSVQNHVHLSAAWRHESRSWQPRSSPSDPTLAEAIMEAAQDVKGESVHK